MALKQSGLLILEEFYYSELKHQSSSPKTTDLLYDLPTLIDDFESLRILEALEDLSYLDEGPRHLGLGDIVRWGIVA